MKEKITASISLADISEDLVIEYLCTHPEFFQSHEDLLENLHIPHECSPAISLIERQVQLLRQKAQCQQTELMNAVHIAKENERIFELTKMLTLQLLKANSAKGLVVSLQKILEQDFAVDVVRFGLHPIPKDIAEHNSVFAHLADEQSAVKELLKVNKAVCKRLTNEQRLYFFANKAKSIQSCAIIPIGRQGRHGFLALGSLDKVKFHPDKETLFLDYIGKILSQLLSPYLTEV